MLTFLFAAFLAAAPSSPDAGRVVQAPVANMYSLPTEDSSVVSQAFYSTAVTVLEERRGWAKIRTPDSYQGWALSKHLRAGASAYGPTKRTATVRSLFAHLYREPNVTHHAPLLTVPFESRLEIIAEPHDRRWLEVRLVDDRAAWLQRGDVELAPVRPTIPQLLAFAKQFLGLPYTWGGTTSYGYDCAGFTQMLLRRRGVIMPRDADQQALWSGMQDVPTAQLQPGDLIFFGASMRKITHTGMMLEHGEFIHATTHERPVLQISRLADAHWTRLLLCARRPKDNWKDKTNDETPRL